MVAEGNWQASVPFSLTTATVYRDGKAAQLSDIQTLDVVYWSKSMHTVWAWSGKATGTIQQINTTSNPTAVTVGGKTYAIETASAAYDLSDLGSFRVGDSVTLLLGRTGGVAAVRTSGGSSAAVYGVVTAIGTASYQDENGHSYTADTIALIASKARLADFLLLSKNLPSPRSPQRYASATSAPSSVFAGPPRGTSAPRSSSTATFAGPAGGCFSQQLNLGFHD